MRPQREGYISKKEVANYVLRTNSVTANSRHAFPDYLPFKNNCLIRVTSCAAANPTPHAARSKRSKLKQTATQGEKMTKSIKTMMITAALSGMLGGAASRAQAQTTPQFGQKTNTQSRLLKSSLQDQDDKDKHACKGKNDCKGKGGCKSSDNGCKGKNDCKGKGGCATDGSKPPQTS
jgi:hypothetical protein